MTTIDSSTEKTVPRLRRSRLNRRQTDRFVDKIFGADLHAKRVESLANGVSGALRSATLSVHAVGAAYSELASIRPKHGIKQVDRFLSNKGIDVEALTPEWAKFIIGSRKEIALAIDWTDFDDDDHTTLAAYVATQHGRATPLAWMTVKKSTLKGKQKGYEYDFIERLHKAISEDVDVTVLADRGFGDQKLYDFLDFCEWNYIIRFRGNIGVEDLSGESKPAAAWLSPSGRAKKLRKALVTANRFQVAAVVVVHSKGMKDPWCLATSHGEKTSSYIVKLYAKRFTIEETFRDQKDLRFGMGLRATHIHNATRRDRLLLLAAVAQALLTLLGAAAESVGLDRALKANTVTYRTHSLFRQGAYWYRAIPTMRDEWLRPLMEAFDKIISGHKIFEELLGVL
jgi:hypothetical protein